MDLQSLDEDHKYGNLSLVFEAGYVKSTAEVKVKATTTTETYQCINGSLMNTKANFGVEEATLCEEGDSASEEGDEPTELWLQRNISKLSVANNELVAKMKLDCKQ